VGAGGRGTTKSLAAGTTKLLVVFALKPNHRLILMMKALVLSTREASNEGLDLRPRREDAGVATNRNSVPLHGASGVGRGSSSGTDRGSG
jgi:hypothetical protein